MKKKILSIIASGLLAGSMLISGCSLPFGNENGSAGTERQDVIGADDPGSNSDGTVGTIEDPAAAEGINKVEGQNTVEEQNEAEGQNAAEDLSAGAELNSGNGTGFDSTDPSIENLPKELELSFISQIPDYSWQTDVTFPNWRGFTDDTLALNNMMSFDYYSGQGSMYISADAGITGFDVYINNVKADTSKVIAGGNYEIDFSSVALNGRNTVQISNVKPYDEELKVRVCVPYPTVIEGEPEESGISKDALDLIDEIVSCDVSNGFTSSQIAVIRYGKLVYQNAWGNTNTYNPDGSMKTDLVPVTNDTLYDLASVTKMATVNLAIQKLVTDGQIGLDDKIADFIGSDFYDLVLDFGYNGRAYVGIDTQKVWKKNLTIRDVLCHQAGFPADPRYFNLYVDAPSQWYSVGYENILYSGANADEATKAQTLIEICKTPLMYEPGSETVYSDVDYMLLGFVIENVTGKDLNTYMRETFWEPMGLTHITFNPLKNGFSKDDCAATELNGNTRDGVITFPGVRDYTLQGEVHDEKAYYSMGGVSGHAGLFSNATDLAKLFSTMLTGGYGENSFYSKNVIDMFTAPKAVDYANWGLGWWREGEFQRVGFFGTESGNNAYGHQGWTGTIVIIDPDRELVIVYLTNKINTSLIDKKSNANRFRGGAYTSATLGFVPQIIGAFMDTDEDVTGQLNSLAASMARESVDLIPDNAPGTNPYFNNAKSKIELLEKRINEHGATEYADLAVELKELLSSKY